jgi:hypothetical protein
LSHFGIEWPDATLGVPLTDTEMKQAGSFTGWDFVGESINGTEDIWTICEGRDYPHLSWENQICPQP